MMHAKPVIALDSAPINEIVVNNETGMLVAPGNKEALTAALEALLTNKNLREKLGANGYKRYSEVYEESVVMKKIADLYSIVALEENLRK
jgi:glycosyltransferase involved in cell wall biosynthesis